ncbi:MAG: amidohydrolase/deacetylase family metallohydrolase, partial [Spirochaetes bacterium]|nr:amidohydrolase/deacetylase family metallohydrolase [Spirochaetota bacterium]
DPLNTVASVQDILIKNGRIEAIGKGLNESGSKVIDLSGLIVTPGLVDIHTHLFASANIPEAWAGDYSVYPDCFSFRTGVTTMVDAGSSGWKNFSQFRSTIIERSKTRVFAFLNIASYGMITDALEQDSEFFDVKNTVQIAEKNRDCIVGIKTAHYQKPDWLSVERAIEAGTATNLPIMVDFGYFRKERPYWELVTRKLRKGDFSTHCLRGPVPVINKQGKVYDYFFEAHERGVLFDLGHGAGSFLFRNAVPALQQNFPLHTISTDLHVLSMNLHMMDMPTTLSKMLALGMSLSDVIKKSTCDPARYIGHSELGHLSPGAIADIAVWNLLEGNYWYSDSFDGRIPAKHRLICEMTIKDGIVMWDWNSRSSVDYHDLGDHYGIRENLEVLIFPEDSC